MKGLGGLRPTVVSCRVDQENNGTQLPEWKRGSGLVSPPHGGSVNFIPSFGKTFSHEFAIGCQPPQKRLGFV
jgi:hypothetical protein